jgi:hypothetical protein
VGVVRGRPESAWASNAVFAIKTAFESWGKLIKTLELKGLLGCSVDSRASAAGVGDD